MNKTEVITRIEQMGEYERFVDEPISKMRVMDLVHQIDEAPYPRIPKFIADYLIFCRNKSVPLSRAYSLCNHLQTFGENRKKARDVVEWLSFGVNQEKLALAWIYGYEVEPFRRVGFFKEGNSKWN